MSATGSSDAPVTGVRQFKFVSREENAADTKDLLINIPENVDPHFSMYTWPSAVVVAQYIWYHHEDFRKQNVIELGAGTSLPGIVAAKCGANVTLSDNLMFPKSLKNCYKSCEANNMQLKVLGIKWGHFSEDLITLKDLNYVIMSDCFYEPNDFEDIVVTIAFLLERNAGCKCIVGYQVRCTNWTISDLLTKWCLTAVNIPLETFNADDSCLAGSNLPGSHTIQLLQISSSS